VEPDLAPAVDISTAGADEVELYAYAIARMKLRRINSDFSKPPAGPTSSKRRFVDAERLAPAIPAVAPRAHNRRPLTRSAGDATVPTPPKSWPMTRL
jgi:hypothetical protein